MGWRRLKRLRSYTYEDAALVIDVSTRTIREWVTRYRIPVFTGTRPHLIMGEDLIACIAQRRETRRTTLTLDTFKCFKCRDAVKPALGLVDCDLSKGKAVHLTALCETCETPLNKFAARKDLDAMRAIFDLHITGDCDD